MLKKLFALANIALGLYCMKWGWERQGIYLVTVFFAGSVMAVFGLALLFLPEKKKKPLKYKDVYREEE
ncbi:hypothetical protein ACUUL3_15570 [Thiovibrio sp. JS02]